uniref:DNMT3 ADD domain-containing protein n=1 Tax=Ursus maritimus TaxID=29073 RepID=A0A452VNS5_URSMA
AGEVTQSPLPGGWRSGPGHTGQPELQLWSSPSVSLGHHCTSVFLLPRPAPLLVSLHWSLAGHPNAHRLRRCYCFECVDTLVGPGTSGKAQALSNWVCFLCLPFPRSGLLQRRRKWRGCLKAFCDRESENPLETYKTVPVWKREPVRVLSLFGDIRRELVSLGFLENGSAPGRLKHLDDVTDVVRRDVEGWGPFDLVYGSTPPIGHACDHPPGKRLQPAHLPGPSRPHTLVHPEGQWHSPAVCILRNSCPQASLARVACLLGEYGLAGLTHGKPRRIQEQGDPSPWKLPGPPPAVLRVLVAGALHGQMRGRTRTGTLPVGFSRPALF